MDTQNNGTELSHDTKVIITILAFIIFYPAGIVLMFVWDIGPQWLRILLILPFIIFLFFFNFIFAAIFGMFRF